MAGAVLLYWYVFEVEGQVGRLAGVGGAEAGEGVAAGLVQTVKDGDVEAVRDFAEGGVGDDGFEAAVLPAGVDGLDGVALG